MTRGKGRMKQMDIAMNFSRTQQGVEIKLASGERPSLTETGKTGRRRISGKTISNLSGQSESHGKRGKSNHP